MDVPVKIRADLTRDDEPGYASWWQRRCPAVGYFQRGEHPRCDLRLGHGGWHAADRGTYEAEWTEAVR